MEKITIYGLDVSAKCYGVYFQKNIGAKWEDARNAFLNEETAMRAGLSIKGPLYPIVVTMPCGKSIAFNNLTEIPMTDMPCPCDNPNHWFVKYNEVNNENN